MTAMVGPMIKTGEVSVFVIPTSSPEADGTFSWTKTTMVLVRLVAGDLVGLGYTYANEATAHVVRDLLSECVVGKDAFHTSHTWHAMNTAVRNLGRPGICAMSISAIDCALWDLKARLLGVPLVNLWGQARASVDVYGSGGFTTYSDDQLQRQFQGWADSGIKMMKMKVGSHPERDLHRVKSARKAIGKDCRLFVDANGGYSRKEALRMAEQFREFGVEWFEEPVSADDLEGLRLLRDRGPAGIEIAAGEYGYDAVYFRRMLDAGAVDVLQADCTRCLGHTGFLQADALCVARSMPLSAHCAPAQHLHVCCAAQQLRHIEYFHDHVRIERMLFEGIAKPKDGKLTPDLSRPGIGLEFKKADAQRFAA